MCSKFPYIYKWKRKNFNFYLKEMWYNYDHPLLHCAIIQWWPWGILESSIKAICPYTKRPKPALYLLIWFTLSLLASQLAPKITACESLERPLGWTSPNSLCFLMIKPRPWKEPPFAQYCIAGWMVKAGLLPGSCCGSQYACL